MTVLGAIALEIAWYLPVPKRLRIAPGALGRQLLHQAVVFVTLIAAGHLHLETASAQDAQEEAMRKSSGLSEVAAAQTKVLSAYSGALALSAATWGAPLVTMYALRYNDAVGPDRKGRSKHDLADGGHFDP